MEKNKEVVFKETFNHTLKSMIHITIKLTALHESAPSMLLRVYYFKPFLRMRKKLDKHKLKAHLENY
ncbi:hypothetical protein PR048_012849, partial [Dryococelus australis]